MRFSLDTNLLVYAIDDQAGDRHPLARQIIEQAAHRDCCLTLQAVSEFYWVATRKSVLPRQVAAAQADDWLKLFVCAAASAGAVRAALTDAAVGRASYWDALLVATAREAGCRVLLTEDLASGANLGGVRIDNPFAGAGRLSPLTCELLGLDEDPLGS